MRPRTVGLAALLLLGVGCASLQQLIALKRVRFDLDRVSGLRLAGIDLERKRTFADLTPADVLALGAAVARRDLPLDFTAIVRAENPDDATVTARMVRFAWTLYLDDVETIHGTVVDPVELPPGSPQLVPIAMQLDLLDFFDDTAENLFKLAAALLSPDADPVTISLYALPTVETPLGPISYPEPIRIIRRPVGGSR
jgi:hypothetical protein